MPPLPPLEPDLLALAARDRLRKLTLLDGASRTHPTLDGHPTLTFASNDYLGLADHPDLLEAAASAGRRHGFGAGASRLLSGHLPPHLDLERALAALVRLPAALLCSTGYQANLAAVTALAGRDDLIVSDQANHASLIDGCRLSRATIRIYRHLDPASAREALQTPAPSGSSFRHRFLITESLFSMDGDRAPLSALADLAREQGAALLVDEAHALGVLGPGGRGLCQEAGVVPDLLVGTLGKAFGSFGGFIAGTDLLRSHMINRARSFIYTTAPPPPIAAAALAALRIALSGEGDRRRAALARNVRDLHAALARLPLPRRPAATDAPIIPLVIGADHATLALSHELARRGLFVPPIRPPTVAEGTARLRITLSAAHTEGDIATLAQGLAAALS